MGKIVRISDREWENIEFRKKKYKELIESLDEVISGRDTSVLAFINRDGERYSTSKLDSFVGELVSAMDEYGRRSGRWIKGPEAAADDEVCMPKEFKIFVTDYLFCIMRLMISDMDWVGDMFIWPFKDTFQQLVSHSRQVRSFALRSEQEKYMELWEETYYGARGGMFDLFTLAYESLTGANIKETLTPVMESGIEKNCFAQQEQYEKWIDEALDNLMSDEEISEALHELAEEETYFDENYFDEETQRRYRKSEENFRKSFVDKDVFCERYIKLREMVYTTELGYPFKIFDELVEGMIDVFLCRRGVSLYVNVDKFIKSYTVLKKQLIRISDIREEV